MRLYASGGGVVVAEQWVWKKPTLLFDSDLRLQQ